MNTIASRDISALALAGLPYGPWAMSRTLRFARRRLALLRGNRVRKRKSRHGRRRHHGTNASREAANRCKAMCAMSLVVLCLMAGTCALLERMNHYTRGARHPAAARLADGAFNQ